MIGKNTFHLNQATMMKIVENYLENRMLADGVRARVTQVHEIQKDSYNVFEVVTDSDPEPEKE